MQNKNAPMRKLGKPVASSRGLSLPWAQAVRAASRTNGAASRISHAGTLSFINASSNEEPDELLLPEVVDVNDWALLFIFLHIMLSSASTIWRIGPPGTRAHRVDARHSWCCWYQVFSFGKESINTGSVEKLIIFENLLLFILSLGDFPKDANVLFRTNKRYSGPNCDPNAGVAAPPITCSTGGWLNCHNLSRRTNALENTTWQEIFSPVAAVHDTLGTHDPNASHIGISAAASSGTWKKMVKWIQRIRKQTGCRNSEVNWRCKLLSCMYKHALEYTLNLNIPHHVGRKSEHCLQMKSQSVGHSKMEHS